MGEEEEEDYMSDTFMLADVRPGVSQSRSSQRILRMETERDEANERIRALPRKVDLERERRNEALSTPLGQDTKGFAMLTRMGYKPGMTLGKVKEDGSSGSGIPVPIGIDLKTDRTGLGHASHEKNQAEKRVREHVVEMVKRAKIHNAMIGDFRDRRRIAAAQKRLMGDIEKCRRVCAELDARLNLKSPSVSWYWPIQKVPSSIEGDEDEEEARFVYANGQSAPSEDILDDFSEDLLQERLFMIIAYLRATHFYCNWCGHQSQDADELSRACPGSKREDHDSEDFH